METPITWLSKYWCSVHHCLSDNSNISRQLVFPSCFMYVQSQQSMKKENKYNIKEAIVCALKSLLQIDLFSRNCDNCKNKNHQNNCQEKQIYMLSSGKWLYWPLKPKIFSTFDVFIIICTDNVKWFLVKFENRHTLIYLFWLYTNLSICILKCD
jgi:hypothetical protein